MQVQGLVEPIREKDAMGRLELVQRGKNASYVQLLSEYRSQTECRPSFFETI
jgi:hypothetical protein